MTQLSRRMALARLHVRAPTGHPIQAMSRLIKQPLVHAHQQPCVQQPTVHQILGAGIDSRLGTFRRHQSPKTAGRSPSHAPNEQRRLQRSMGCMERLCLCRPPRGWTGPSIMTLATYYSTLACVVWTDSGAPRCHMVAISWPIPRLLIHRLPARADRADAKL